MNCGAIDNLLDRHGDRKNWPAEAREHVAGCPRCSLLVERLSMLDATGEPDAALTERVTRKLKADLRPVRPLPALPVEVGLLTATAAGIGIALAAATGLKGWHALTADQRWWIFPALALAAVLLAWIVSLEMEPGRGRARAARALCWLTPAALFGIPWGVLQWAPGDEFEKHALLCFLRGLFTAVAILAGAWFWIRRGFFVSPQRAYTAIGLLAGIGGFISQELYCPVAETAHVTIAHAMLPVAATLAGLLAGRLRTRVRIAP